MYCSTFLDLGRWIARLGLASVVIVVAGFSGTSTAVAHARHCPRFSVPRTYDEATEVTFEFSNIRADDISCRKTRELITFYLYGRGHAAGSAPTDGVIIEGWNVLVLADRASGHRGRAQFTADYR
jgi:hypothetical protein